MAAIPLQGLALASMLYCGPGGEHQAQKRPAATAEAAGHHVVQAGAQHDHAAHGHAAEAQDATAGDPGKQLPDAMHKCGICASCCHLVAISAFHALAVFMPAPQAELAEPFVLIHARPSPVPDKPPRA